MKRARARAPSNALRLVLDSGGLTALFGRSERARAWARWIIQHQGAIAVPTPVLVECVTGDAARDAELNRWLSVLQKRAPIVVAPDEKTARTAGRLRHRTRTDDGIDALVAAAAVGDGTPSVVLTSDPDDLERLLAGEPNVHVQRV